MLVEESPLRGSEGGEDFEAGREAMVNMDRELVLRDRNHPATVIWSAANEWTTPIPVVVPAMLALDDTRPIIADGVGDFDSRFVNMEHYVNGLGALPTKGAGSPLVRINGHTAKPKRFGRWITPGRALPGCGLQAYVYAALLGRLLICATTVLRMEQRLVQLHSGRGSRKPRL